MSDVRCPAPRSPLLTFTGDRSRLGCPGWRPRRPDSALCTLTSALLPAPRSLLLTFTGDRSRLGCPGWRPRRPDSALRTLTSALLPAPRSPLPAPSPWSHDQCREPETDEI